MTDQEIDTVIANWHTLNKDLRHFSEAEVKQALHREMVGNKRTVILKRLHSRFCKLRQDRELGEMITILEAPSFMTGVTPNLE